MGPNCRKTEPEETKPYFKTNHTKMSWHRRINTDHSGHSDSPVIWEKWLHSEMKSSYGWACDQIRRQRVLRHETLAAPRSCLVGLQDQTPFPFSLGNSTWRKMSLKTDYVMMEKEERSFAFCADGKEKCACPLCWILCSSLITAFSHRSQGKARDVRWGRTCLILVKILTSQVIFFPTRKYLQSFQFKNSERLTCNTGYQVKNLEIKATTLIKFIGLAPLFSRVHTHEW